MSVTNDRPSIETPLVQNEGMSNWIKISLITSVVVALLAGATFGVSFLPNTILTTSAFSISSGALQAIIISAVAVGGAVVGVVTFGAYLYGLYGKSLDCNNAASPTPSKPDISPPDSSSQQIDGLSGNNNEIVGVRQPLKNFGNTCWFNSVIKLLSTTSFYDPILINSEYSGLVSPEKADLQKMVRELIENLRANKSSKKELKNQIRALIRQIRIDLPEFASIGREQHDAAEFLVALTRILSWSVLDSRNEKNMDESLLFPRLCTTYSCLESGAVKYGKLHSSTPLIMVTIPK